MIVLALTLAAAAQDFTLAERRQMMADFASCSVKYEPELAARAVKEQWRNHELINHRVLISSDCLPRTTGRAIVMTAQGPMLLYALADALIDREPNLDISRLDQVVPLEHRPVDEEWFARQDIRAKTSEQKALVQDQRQSAQSMVALSRFGECVVRQRPAEALALVRTKPATPEEKTAFAAVTPVLANCISEGAKIAMLRDVIRGTVALNLYRLAKAPRTLAPAAGAAQ